MTSLPGARLQTNNIVANEARIVAGSKALHHLLPDLMVPIDRAYTQKFFGWQSPTFQYKQETCFVQAFAGFAQIARRTNPAQYVSSGWHSSRTKVIDNALVGFISDQQAAAEKSNSKVQRASVPNFHDPVKDDMTIRASKPLPRSLIAAILNWFRDLVARS